MVVVFNIKLDLAGGFLLPWVANAPISRVNSHPAHAAKLVVNHEPQVVRHVRLVGDVAQAVFLADIDSFLDDLAEAGDEHGVLAVNLQELLLVGLVVHDRVLFDDFNVENRVPGMHLLV